MTVITKHYKIRDRNTGLYSKGGFPPSWSKTGKTWTNMSGLMNHLGQLRKKNNQTFRMGPNVLEEFVVPESWELVEIEVRVDESALQTVADFLQARKPQARIFKK